jgi:hypothetical protein
LNHGLRDDHGGVDAIPLNSTQLYIKGMLDGLIVPGNSLPLQAYITPEDPRDDENPAAYIWPSTGDENRQAVPRVGADIYNPSEAGWKTMNHQMSVWVTWFNDDGDPNPDISFPAVIDVIMYTLRSSANPAVVYDPLTALPSQLIDVGERMTYHMAGVRTAADQRFLRYDAELTLSIIEELQS